MKKITTKANAKINLYLDVASKRDDGYHNIESVMQSVSLADIVTVTLSESAHGQSIRQKFVGSDLPCDETNLCYKAAAAYLNYYGITECDIEIEVIKNIPEAAGLAGGSTDAAAVIRALDELYGKESGDSVLCEIGLTVGSDVAFCIMGGTCAVTGRGENVERLAPLTHYYAVIAKSDNESVSTKEAYRRIDTSAKREVSAVTFADYVKAVGDKDTKTITDGVYNIFQSVMSDVLVDTYKIIESMKKDGALCSIMSGSGPSVFGLFADKASAEKACDNLKEKYFAVTCEFE